MTDQIKMGSSCCVHCGAFNGNTEMECHKCGQHPFMSHADMTIIETENTRRELTGDDALLIASVFALEHARDDVVAGDIKRTIARSLERSGFEIVAKPRESEDV